MTSSSRSEQTTGSLDMGGASSQIAFQCSDGQSCENNTALNYDLFDESYKVFSSSMMCYGIEEAMRRYLAWLVYDNFNQNGQITNQLENYCQSNDNAGDDFLQTFPNTKEYIFGSPCTSLKNGAFQNAVDALDNDFSFGHLVSYDEELCNEVLQNFVEKSACESLFNKGDCLDPGLYPNPEGNYFAMSSYYWSFGLLINWQPGMSYQQIQEEITKICNVEAPDNFETGCFEVSLIFKILQDGFHFDSEAFTNIDFVLDVEGEEVAWTLGFLVNESNNIDEAKEEGEHKISAIAFGLMTTFGILLMLLAAAALFMFHRTQNNNVLNRV